jgi:hypothetical protein
MPKIANYVAKLYLWLENMKTGETKTKICRVIVRTSTAIPESSYGATAFEDILWMVAADFAERQIEENLGDDWSADAMDPIVIWRISNEEAKKYSETIPFLIAEHEDSFYRNWHGCSYAEFKKSEKFE